jgi:hypothetical protein
LPTQPTLPPDPLAVSKAVARRHLADIGETKLDELIKTGRLKATKVDGRVLIDFASVKALALGEVA